MYAYIKGKLVFADSSSAIVEANGIGFRVYIPVNLKLPKFGEEVLIHLSQIIKEDAHYLYGFITEEERDLFEQLIAISGIGPKIAISLIGHLTFSELYSAVLNRDINAITKVPGIGKKLSERLIIELRDKFTKRSFPQLAVELPIGSRAQDAINALINLGYNQNAAQKAIQKSLKETTEDADLADLITLALKNV